MYTKPYKGKVLIVFLYVDDLLYASDMMIEEFEAAMKIEFDMTDIWLMMYLLGIEIQHYANGIFVCQQKYATDMLQNFRIMS